MNEAAQTGGTVAFGAGGLAAITQAPNVETAAIIGAVTVLGMFFITAREAFAGWIRKGGGDDRTT